MRVGDASGRIALAAVLACVALLGSAGCRGGGRSSSTEDALARELQQVFDEDAKGLPGAQAAVYVPGRGLWVGATGRANLETGVRVTPATLFGLGSVSKHLTAAVVLELAEEGVLSLDDPISKWEPGVPEARRITVRMLLENASGLVEPSFGPLDRRPPTEWTPRNWIDLLHDKPLFPPGEGFHY